MICKTNPGNTCFIVYLIYTFVISHFKGVFMNIAKVFWSGRSQAVRLPKDFRFDTEKVHIRRHGSTIILEPVAANWKWLDAICNKLDKDFVDAVKEKPEQQKRPALDEFFK
jgi:antitoxin VapB